jgi:acetaldehyde dehydrogenase (acetylating)
MMPICIGTIIVPIVNASSAALNRNRNLAKAKPARVQNATVPIVTQVDTITELIRPWVIGAVFSASLMLCQTDPVGSIGGVFAFSSALVCDAITIV